MGLFKKVKEILFDEEEDFTEQIKITPEMRNEPAPVRIEKVAEPEKKVMPEEIKQPTEPKKPTINVSERELFKNDSTFPFLDFDEEEFDNQKSIKKAPVVEQAPPVPPKRPTNVFEYERKKKIEKRTDYGRYEKVEVTETTERRRFKPSPIISPVYGILNQDYDKSDILQRKNPDQVDIKTVREKAFGDKREEVEIKPAPTPISKPSYYEEKQTVTITRPEERVRKVKSIDELLEDTSDLVVDIDTDLDRELDSILNSPTNQVNREVVREPIAEPLREAVKEAKPQRTYEPEPEFDDIKEDTKEMKVPDVDNTLESDLFDLIDSMYDSKEDGE